MTREGIKEYLMQINEAPEPINRWKPDILCELIDQIYDDFEEQLTAKDKELEYDQRNAAKSQNESVMLLNKVKILEEQLDMEKRKAYLDGSNDCYKSLKEQGKLK